MFQRFCAHHSLIFILFILSLDINAQEVPLYPIKTGNVLLSDIVGIIESSIYPNIVYSPDRIPNRTVEIKESFLSEEQLLKLLRENDLLVLKKEGRILLIPIDEAPKERKLTISGYVKDQANGEALIGANVTVNGQAIGTSTNRYGYFSLTLPPGEYTLTSSFIGFNPAEKKIKGNGNPSVGFVLTENTQELEELTISSRSPSYNVESLIPGISTLNFESDDHIPYFMGEVDVFQGSLLLPGIKILGEEASGINVRGGGIDENLILLDEAPIYNPNHYFGLVSVFNPEAVNEIQFLKGFFPPNFGGRAASVISIHQKEGNNQEQHFAGGIGLLSARLLAEGPIKKGISSFLISGRQSLLDPTELGASDVGRNSETFFTDFNAKMNWKLNKLNTLFISSYFGNDRNVTGFDAERRWGNRTFTARWNRQYGKRFFSHFSAVFSEYNYRVSEPQEAGSFIGKFRIIDYSLKAEQTFYVNPTSQIDFGAITTFHRLRPGERLPFDPDDSSTNPLELDSEHGLESGLYISHDWKISKRLQVLYGIRFSSLHNIGPAEVYQYATGETRSDESIIDTVNVSRGKIINSFYNFEPRISWNFRVNKDLAIKGSYNRTYQYIHLISNTITPNPTDIWKLSDGFIAPTRTDHFSLGAYKNFGVNEWESYAEVFFKDIRNAIEYKDGADLLFNPNLETELINAQGRSYGFEFFLKKNRGPTKGWVSYTLSRSERRVLSDFTENLINDGSYFPDDNDKTHDFSLVFLQQLTQRLSVSSTFNYSTGRPITLPAGKFNFEGNPIPHFIGRNQNRITDYHRLDLSLRLAGKKIKKNGDTRKFSDFWTLTVYNAYARKNAFSYFFRASEALPGETEIVRYSVFGTAIPSITYNFKF